MARKEATQTQSHGLHDVIGILLGAAALLLLVALLSYDPLDLGVNVTSPNNPPHNLGGPLGAWTALHLFLIFGIGAFMMPVLLLMFGLGYLFRFLSYLQRRWLWGVALLLCCICLGSLFQDNWGWLGHLQRSLNAPNVGGLVGLFLNAHVLRYVGKVGASIVLATIYLISLLYLTNFQLGQWCRRWWA